ncbi:MAG: maleylpyruvate isomerase family mycothiol-dependent enzyme [Specibacter sp.]
MVARHDLTTDPGLQEALLQSRRGNAFFARKLNEFPDDELDGDSLLPGWTRRHVADHIGYNARAIARLIEWAATGVQTPMNFSPTARNPEIDFGATLSPIALRNLTDHAAMHLSMEWRDLPDANWETQVTTAQGRTVPARKTVWMRTREVWLHAVDLNHGATISDIPAPLPQRLLTNISGAWKTRGADTGLIVQVQGNDIRHGDTSRPNAVTVTGTLTEVAVWAAGRGTTTDAPRAPAWI